MKVLSIDGGGIRGIIPAMILAKIEELSGDSISNLFDLIAGTSTGGLIALALSVDDGNGKPKYTAEEIIDLYRTKGDRIFDRNIWHRILSAGSILEEKYQNQEFIQIVNEYFGNQMLSQTLTEVIIPSYETERRIPWFFKSKNAKNPERKNYDFKLKDVALATTAAPTYFEPHKVLYKENDYLSLIDGGIFANNPALCAYIDAKTMFHKTNEEIKLISLGTGQLTRRFYHHEVRDWGSLQWVQPILSCVFDGVTDTVDYQLSKILGEKNYYRLQDELIEASDDLDNIDPGNIRKLVLMAETIIHEKEDKIKNIVDLLCS